VRILYADAPTEQVLRCFMIPEVQINGKIGASAHPLVSVVIVNCSSGDYLVNCVTSVIDSAYPMPEVLSGS
jgi:hypothetical protein